MPLARQRLQLPVHAAPWKKWSWFSQSLRSQRGDAVVSMHVRMRKQAQPRSWPILELGENRHSDNARACTHQGWAETPQ